MVAPWGGGWARGGGAFGVGRYGEVLGSDDENTLIAVGKLGKVLLAQSKLAEAEPLLVQAVAWSWNTVGSVSPFYGSLVELRRQQWWLVSEEQQLVTQVADLTKAAGPQIPATLEAEASAARLWHAQPERHAELHAAVRHQLAAKLQRVLNALWFKLCVVCGFGLCFGRAFRRVRV